jgi:hypothetical protein
VIIESPYAGDRERNARYVHACIADCLARGEAPFASHVLYTVALDDDVTEQRAAGIAAGLSWGAKADATVVYADLGISTGMRYGIEDAERRGRPIEYRALGGSFAMNDDESYREHVKASAKACRCCRCCQPVCAGVLAGGMCDEMSCLHVHDGAWGDADDELEP